MLILLQTTPLAETTFIWILVTSTLLFTLFTVSVLLYLTLRRQRQLHQRLETQEEVYNYANKLMQIKLDVREQMLTNMSAEIHENIAQILAAAKMKMYFLYTHADDVEHRTIAEEASLLMRDVLHGLREMAYSMKGINTLRNGLKESIEKELGRIVAAHRIKCNFTWSGTERCLHPDKELILFSIIVEAVANAVMYSHSTSLSVSMQYSPGHLDVVVEDYGSGFDIGKLTREGKGIPNIKERTRLLNGTVNITSEMGKGTRVQLKIPVLNTHE